MSDNLNVPNKTFTKGEIMAIMGIKSYQCFNKLMKRIEFIKDNTTRYFTPIEVRFLAEKTGFDFND